MLGNILQEVPFGIVTVDSTSKAINIIATKNSDLISIVGRMIYVDLEVDQNIYRAIGTVTDVRTSNPAVSSAYESVLSNGVNMPSSKGDLRKLNFQVQATFNKNSMNVWMKHSSALPTSPSTSTPAYFLTEQIINDMLSGADYPTVGFFRGMGSAPQPLLIPNFGGDAGSSHSAVIGKSGSGKDLALNTPIPTPNGWTTMGELQDGDVVFSEHGVPVTVLKAHDIITTSVCYNVEFCDGSVLLAGSGHLWYTESEDGHGNRLEGTVQTTQQIIDDNLVHYIPLTKPVEWAVKDENVNAHELGSIIAQNVVASIGGGDKRIPESILYGSVESRRVFLESLGTNSIATYQNHKLAQDINILAASLGYYTTKKYDATSDKGNVVTWDSTKVERKIVNIIKVDTVDTRCITVDSPTALYLAGETFIPTHNTAFYTYMLSTFMSDEQHAVIIIDPQGQWSNENGMVFSPQNFAKGLGRDVHVLRVAEDIKLPMDVEIFTRMLNKIRLWSKFRRMGSENLEAFSDAVASRVAKHRNFDGEPREFLANIFKEIANSNSALSRIYTRGERRDDFQRDLLLLAGENVIDPVTEEMEIIDADELEDVEENWENILSLFNPLLNLFSSENLSGGKRKPLGGNYGFLANVLKIRNSSSAPAPYVILDMSPNIELHAKAGLLSGQDNNLNMQQILDNDDIKALIIQMILAEMKKSSEIAFSQGTGNLNTQIVFDEAWRYAPEGKASREIEELADKLEGFALDTRKYGIGWTYILQSPADLKHGIWKQLTYVYVGHGLIGDDFKRLTSLTDDINQLDLYKQFIPPKSTGIYPFMLMGPISPVIFTTAPAFVNVFNNNDDFMFYNKKWIDKITEGRSLPRLTMDVLSKPLKVKAKFTKNENTASKGYNVGGKSNGGRSKPQTAPKFNIPKPSEASDFDIDDLPF